MSSKIDRIEEMLLFDKEHIWHPYTSMVDPLPVYLCHRAEGVYLYLDGDKKVIDGMSSWWCTIHGYNNKRLNRAARAQITKMSHVMFGGITHAPAIELAELLTQMLPSGLDRVFYSDSGSVSVEVALKMAIQYQYTKGHKEKNKIATILGGYHGDTWHGMSVCDPEGGMHSLYNGRLAAQCFASRPKCRFDEQWVDSDFDSMRELLSSNHDTIAAVILEPIVQGAGGMWMYHPSYLKELSKVCKRYDILLIADEVATGFGRTGKMFAFEWADIVPDIICLGKALTGGFVSFAATVASKEVALTISENAPHSFMHGPTFMANPLSAAVACESLKIIKESNILYKISKIEEILRQELEPARGLSSVADVRVLGAIGVLEMRESVDMAAMQKFFVDRGVWIRPFGRLIYIMTQYIITPTALRKLCRVMRDAASMC